MRDEKEPVEPFGTVLEAAIAMHELFLSYQAAGFSENQALYLCAQAVRPTAGE